MYSSCKYQHCIHKSYDSLIKFLEYLQDFRDLLIFPRKFSVSLREQKHHRVDSAKESACGIPFTPHPGAYL